MAFRKNKQQQREGDWGNARFLKDYTLKPTYLIPPDLQRSVPGLRAAVDRSERQVLVKHWPLESTASDEISRALWRNDLRQLHRIASRPSTSDTISALHESGRDAEGFYIVLIAGARTPIQLHLQAQRVPSALRPHAKNADRIWLWRNLSRVAMALGALHEQNLVHRNLDFSTILTVGHGEPDFQICGLERAIRILAPAGECVPRKSEFHRLDDSFAGDWKRFGSLTGNLLLGMDSFKLREREMTPRDISAGLTVAEVELLRDLVMIDRGSDVDGVRVLSRVEDILRDLEGMARKQEGRPILVVSLGDTSPVSAIIATTARIAAGDIQGQLAFIENDLSHDVGAAAVGSPDEYALILRGSCFNYHLVDYREGRGREPTNWAKAFCQRISPATYRSQRILDQQSISSVLFQAVPLEQSRRQTTPSAFWVRLRARLRPSPREDSEFEIQNQALILTQILECLIAVTSEFPVEIVGAGIRSSRTSEERFYLRVRAREDRNRQELSKLVGHRERIGQRLRNALEEEVSSAESWILRPETVGFDVPDSETRWRPLPDEDDNEDPTSITFVGDRAAPSHLNGVLVRADATGTQGQLRRRLKALAALREHTELSHMLRAPRARLHRVDEHSASVQINGLDAHKRDALKGILSIVPLYLVQGPPGVGKTRLVAELMKHRFGSGTAERVLFSAQSHSAIDHLRKEVAKVLPPESDGGPLLVRCRSKDPGKPISPQEISSVTDRLVRSVVESDLFKLGPPLVKTRLQRLVPRQGNAESVALADEDMAKEYFRVPLEDLVLRAADIVFATSNSAELEDLVQDGAQFDWTIVEEAAKATGSELIGALLLSYRRVLIGDHKQLPPFDGERVRALFDSEATVRRALTLAHALIRPNLRDSQVTALLNEFAVDREDSDGVPLKLLCENARRLFFLFESLFVAEVESCREAGKRSRFAKELLFQHRMHPVLARLISRAFYSNRLKTDREREREFAAKRSPVYSSAPGRLPNVPLVWVDMPWKQSARQVSGGEEYPLYHNPLEVEAVCTLCSLLRDGRREREGASSIALLSPYAEQVKRLRRVASRGSNPLRAQLRKFSSPSQDGEYVHTVDSFQGNEADAVIVSLVRNNSHASIKSSLGFLANARRMNVLLSRARHRLILVGSFRFLLDVAQRNSKDGSHTQIEFLRELIKGVRAAESAGNARIVKWSTLRGGHSGPR